MENLQSNQNNMAEENFKIISKTKNPFLDREELVIEIMGDVPPSNEEVKKITGKDADTVVVNTIRTAFGKQTFVADVFIYNSIESKEKIQTIPQKVRKKMAEEQAAAKKAAEEKAAAENSVEETAESEPTEEQSKESTESEKGEKTE